MFLVEVFLVFCFQSKGAHKVEHSSKKVGKVVDTVGGAAAVAGAIAGAR